MIPETLPLAASPVREKDRVPCGWPEKGQTLRQRTGRSRRPSSSELRGGADPNGVALEDQTMLMTAALSGRAEAVRGRE